MSDLTITDAAERLLSEGGLDARDYGEGSYEVQIDGVKVNVLPNGLCRVMFLQEERVIFETKATLEGQVAIMKLDCFVPVELKE